MSKDNKVVIDLDVWTSQAQYAQDTGHSIQYINQLIHRGKLDKWEIKPLRVVLVRKERNKS
jgi:hypothetical protein